MLYDEHYGCLFLGLTLLNGFMVPFLPFLLLINRPWRINEFLIFVQYVICWFIVLIGIILMEIIIMPLVILKSLRFKLTRIFRSSSGREVLINILKFLFFLIFGLPILIINLLGDIIYYMRVSMKT